MQEIKIGLPGLAEDAVPLTMVQIPAGSFLMGSPETDVSAYDDEKPQHEVTFEHDFYIGKYPVTQAQWLTVMGENPSYFRDKNRPVENISWNDCHLFIKRLNALGLGTFRLPSEAEWEYACRAGSATNYCFGDGTDGLGEYAWYVDNSNGKTHPVGQKKPNAWGLYDMHGNVWEWCRDELHKDYAGAPVDGSAWVGGEVLYRSFRGGSKCNEAWSCRTAYRDGIGLGARGGALGLRLVMEASLPPEAERPLILGKAKRPSSARAVSIYVSAPTEVYEDWYSAIKSTVESIALQQFLPDIEMIDAFRDKRYEESCNEWRFGAGFPVEQNMVVERDLLDIRRSNLVLCYYPVQTQVSTVGTPMELYDAYIHGIPRVVFADKDMLDNYWLKNIASMLFEAPERECIGYWATIDRFADMIQSALVYWINT